MNADLSVRAHGPERETRSLQFMKPIRRMRRSNAAGEFRALPRHPRLLLPWQSSVSSVVSVVSVVSLALAVDLPAVILDSPHAPARLLSWRAVPVVPRADVGL